MVEVQNAIMFKLSMHYIVTLCPFTLCHAGGKNTNVSFYMYAIDEKKTYFVIEQKILIMRLECKSAAK